MRSTMRILAVIVLGSHQAGIVKAQDLVVTSAEELVAAVRAPVLVIEVDGVIEFHSGFDGTNNALPAIERDRVEIRGRAGAEIRATASGFRLAEVLRDGRLTLSELAISGFSTDADGGVLRVEGGRLWLDRVSFTDNHSGGDGGVLHAEQRPRHVEISDSVFEGNSAAGRGGAVSLLDAEFQSDLDQNRFVANQAHTGCAVSLSRSRGARLRNNLFVGPCPLGLVDSQLGRQGLDIFNNTFVVENGFAFRYRVRQDDNPFPNVFAGNILARADAEGRALCRQVPAGEEGSNVTSLGTNISTDASCGFGESDDLVVADSTAVIADSGLPLPAVDGPALDVFRGLGINNPSRTDRRCGIADARGLGRPQDGDGDGEPGCDVGALELQAGTDIGPAQSGAYFDPERNGEGYFVEVLEGGRAWVTFFTYTPIGGAPLIPDGFPAWHFGLGRVVGNSIVVPELKTNHGGRFGDAFDPSRLHSRTIAGLSLVFPDCESGVSEPGTSYLRSEELNIADVPVHTDLFTRAVRLSAIVGCDGEPTGPRSGLSGNFFNPERDGEGIVIQWLAQGDPLVIWYTFGTDSNQLWMISDGAEVDGDTVTAQMIYPAEATAFGPNFDPSEISLEPWGTLTVEYTDCDTIELAYDSVVDGFGSGGYTYQRLTQPAGTACQL